MTTPSPLLPVVMVFAHASQSWLFRRREPVEAVSYEEGTKGKGGQAWSEVWDLAASLLCPIR